MQGIVSPEDVALRDLARRATLGSALSRLCYTRVTPLQHPTVGLSVAELWS